MDQTSPNKSASGKAITTSVPTIKFSTRTEEVIEVFNNCCDEDMASSPQSASPKHERSTTPVDSEQALTSASTPVSDPWRFFSGIKGKITKSVEGKLIEYKNKSAISNTTHVADDAAAGRSPSKPHHTRHATTSNNSPSAGNSRSDSEDISESSLSKTQGGLSTTEGAEMSSTTDDDDEEEDATPSQSQLTSEHSGAGAQAGKQAGKQAGQSSVQQTAATGGLRYRLRTTRSGGGGGIATEATVGENFLRALQRLAGDGHHADHEASGTEQAVDVLQDMELGGTGGATTEPLDMHIDNVTIRSDDVIEVREVSGSDICADLNRSIRENQSPAHPQQSTVDVRTIYNPSQFVDLRHLKGRIRIINDNNKSNNNNGSASARRRYKIQKAICVAVLFLIVYFVVSPLSVYFSGFVLGVVSCLVAVRVRNTWRHLVGCRSTGGCDTDTNEPPPSAPKSGMMGAAGTSNGDSSTTVWMNEWPAAYTPQTYSVAGTQPVHLRLERHLLRVSNTNARLPKRDMSTTAPPRAQTEATPAYRYTRHRIYDLRGATVCLLPVGLTRIRWWSKKYPICIQLPGAEQLSTRDDDTVEKATTPVGEKVVFKHVVRKRRKWHQHSNAKDSAIQFSKLMFDDTDAAGSCSMIDTLDLAVPIDSAATVYEPSEEVERDPAGEAAADTAADDDVTTRLYLFARTCRDKETWYQLLTTATAAATTESLVSSAIYQNYMDTILNVKRSCDKDDSPAAPDAAEKAPQEVGTTSEHLIWLNTLLGRAWYAYATGGEGATARLKDRIQRKLATIRLPAFIEELKLGELSVSPPKMFQKMPIQITWASRPVTDERGIWIDLDLEYESSVVLILQTKLNLMRLKSKGQAVDSSELVGGAALQSEVEHRSAIFHSDVDDSAESSSDEESGGDSDKLLTDDSDAAGPSAGQGGAAAGAAAAATTGSPNHKLIRMVDRIADSRLFRAATEYRYVQRALENVRNTDLCLRVEVRSISGRLCVNLPPPPSDRLWFGFRATPAPPTLRLRALPTVGDYHISLQHVTGWLEKRLVREFHKVLVLPNMEDIVLPGLR